MPDDEKPTTSTTGRRNARSGKGRFVRTIDNAERDAQAARLMTMAFDYGEIAQQMGYADRSGAFRAVQRALLATVAEPAAHLRVIEVARLDIALRKAWDVMCARHIVVNQGRVVCDPDSGEPLTDHGPVLAAINTVIKISESRRKLLGLDAPTRHEVITPEQIEAAVIELSAQLSLPMPEGLAS